MPPEEVDSKETTTIDHIIRGTTPMKLRVVMRDLPVVATEVAVETSTDLRVATLEVTAKVVNSEATARRADTEATVKAVNSEVTVKRAATEATAKKVVSTEEAMSKAESSVEDVASEEVLLWASEVASEEASSEVTVRKADTEATVKVVNSEAVESTEVVVSSEAAEKEASEEVNSEETVRKVATEVVAKAVNSEVAVEASSRVVMTKPLAEAVVPLGLKLEFIEAVAEVLPVVITTNSDHSNG